MLVGASFPGFVLRAGNLRLPSAALRYSGTGEYLQYLQPRARTGGSATQRGGKMYNEGGGGMEGMGGGSEAGVSLFRAVALNCCLLRDPDVTMLLYMQRDCSCAFHRERAGIGHTFTLCFSSAFLTCSACFSLRFDVVHVSLPGPTVRIRLPLARFF